MNMKVGFSSLTCPKWDLGAIVEQAVRLECDAIELRGLQGRLDLPLLPELAAEPDAVRRYLESNKLELACLGCSASFADPHRGKLAAAKAQTIEFIELAAQLRCPYVSVFIGPLPKHADRRATLSRVAEALRAVAPVAARHAVTVLIENGGDYCDSRSLWFLLDVAAHPAVRCCWNPVNAMAVRERPTVSIPRLGRRISTLHVGDAEYDAAGRLLEHRPLGRGDVDLDRTIELLRGIVFDGYLICAWPKLWVPSLPEPEDALPQAIEFLRARVADRQPVLTAYKGDKRAVKFAPADAR